MQDEICGPIIAFCKACDIDHLLEIANNTDYSLTGAFFSNKRKHIERAQKDFMLEIYILIAMVQERLSDINHLVAFICLIRIQKRVA